MAKNKIVELTINNLEEMEEYYDSKLNIYNFSNIIYVNFNFDLEVDSDIRASFITGQNISCNDIKAISVRSNNIRASNVIVGFIYTKSLYGLNIISQIIESENIFYYGICCAYDSLKCKKIEGTKENSKHFCLDNKIEFI